MNLKNIKESGLCKECIEEVTKQKEGAGQCYTICKDCSCYSFAKMCFEAPKETKYYSQGVFFDNEEDFWKFSKLYDKSKLSRHTFNTIMEDAKHDLWLNIEMLKIDITNSEFQEIISEMVVNTIQNLYKQKK